MNRKPSVIVAGAGIGGLTLALELHAAGIECVLLEAAPELTELGVGINLLPHATRSLARLGLLDALSRVAVATKESIFFTRHGQFIALITPLAPGQVESRVLTAMAREMGKLH